MELQLVTFKQAKALKELGYPQIIMSKGEVFDIRTQKPTSKLNYFIHYGDDGYYISAPTLELTAKWLRDEKNIYVFVNMSNPSMTDWSPNSVFTYNYSNGGTILIKNQGCYYSYEDALSAGIDKAIENLKRK